MKLKFLFVVLLAATAAFSQRGQNQFLSQSFIDTTIQSAYLGFVAATREAGGTSQEQAIMRARNVVAELRAAAETDPNRRYILWRLSELEAQIFLEEEEVRLKQQHARVRQINDLVDMFNKEFLVPRPNFANLHALYERIVVVDIRKANEFADLINQKNRSVTQNLRQAITAAFNANNYRQAEIEYNYAVANRRFINLGNADIENWRRRIEARKSADYLTGNIDARVAHINGIVNSNRLLEAKRHIEVLNNDLNGARALLPTPFFNTTRTRLNNLSTTIDRREDSLVQHGFALVNAKRFNEASVFLRDVLLPAGVDRGRIAGIDRAIIESEGGQRRPTFESRLRVENVTEESGSAFSAAMRERANAVRQAHRSEEILVREHFERLNKRAIDRHNKEEDRRAKIVSQNDEVLRNILNLFDQGRPDAAVRLFQRRRTALFAHGSPRLYHDVKVRVNQHTGANDHTDGELAAVRERHRANSREARQDSAANIIREIYDLISANQVVAAYSRYFFNEWFLEENAFPEALVSLRREVVRTYAREMGITR